jgi:hypothetical protein
MTVHVSPHPREETELERALKIVKEYYRSAEYQNAIRPGFIRNPVAWALYQAWREADERRLNRARTADASVSRTAHEIRR